MTLPTEPHCVHGQRDIDPCAPCDTRSQEEWRLWFTRTAGATEILTALGLDPETHSIDRADPSRYTVTDSGDGRVIGLAVLDSWPPSTPEWVLACVGCDNEEAPPDSPYCDTCRALLSAEADGADVR
jgi:hypothetical protein